MAGHRSTVHTLSAAVNHTYKASAILDGAFSSQLSPIELRRAGRVVDNLQLREYSVADAK